MADAVTKEQQTARQTTEAAKKGVERVRKGEPMQAAMEIQEAIPSPVYAYAAGASILTSLILFLTRDRKDWSLFVGQWAPTILLMGIFYKMLKPSKE